MNDPNNNHDGSFDYYHQQHPEQEHQAPILLERPKLSLWQRIGGGALSIAIMVHVVLLVLGAFWVFKTIYPPKKEGHTFMPGGGGSGGAGERNMQHDVKNKKRAQITPVQNVKRVALENTPSDLVIPDPGDSFGEMTPLTSLTNGGISGTLGGPGGGSGDGGGDGGGRGPGHGPGIGPDGINSKLFMLIPESMRKRCSAEDRLQRLTQNGGTPACEEAVKKGLKYLKSKQNSDGSWGNQNKASMTGLALLAYFGHCETPMSEDFGQSCLDGIVYLVNLGARDGSEGKLSTQQGDKHWPYEHAIATYALGEALTFCKELKIDVPNLELVTQQAGQFIIDNQHQSGGWEYGYEREGDRGGDVSIAGWHIQALKACEHSKLKYKGMSGAINAGLKYMVKCQDDSGGFGYTGPAASGGLDYHTLTGVGMLAHQMWGKGGMSPVKKGADYIKEKSKFDYNTQFCDLYGHYYESQAMMQRGGEDWKFYNNLFRDQILNNQNEDGSWKVPGGGQKPRAVAAKWADGNDEGSIYRTALCTLMLEVYYRFLNAGGQGMSGGRRSI